MKIRRDIFSFRNRVVVIIVGVSLGMVSLLYTNNMAKRLKEKEQHDVALWAHAMERANRNVMGGSMEDPLITDMRLFQVPWHDCGKAGLGLVQVGIPVPEEAGVSI